MTGSGGQSFGAFLPAGVTMQLFGDANDYVGKGLSGGRIVVRPHRDATLVAEENVIAGKRHRLRRHDRPALPARVVGERFCVTQTPRPSLVEGVGDHGCEYMTARSRGRARTDRSQLRGRHVGRCGLRPRPRPDLVNREMVDLLELRATRTRVRCASCSRAMSRGPSRPSRRRLLDDWSAARERFTLVLPRDFQRVLDVRAEAQDQGPRPRRTRSVEPDHGGFPWLTPKAFSPPRA